MDSLFSVFEETKNENNQSESNTNNNKKRQLTTKEDEIQMSPKKEKRNKTDEEKQEKNKNEEEKQIIDVSHSVSLPPGYTPTIDMLHPTYPPPNPAKVYPFELDPFQKMSVACLERSESVLVSAHTSAGKTGKRINFIIRLVVPFLSIILVLEEKNQFLFGIQEFLTLISCSGGRICNCNGFER